MLRYAKDIADIISNYVEGCRNIIRTITYCTNNLQSMKKARSNKTKESKSLLYPTGKTLHHFQ